MRRPLAQVILDMEAASAGAIGIDVSVLQSLEAGPEPFSQDFEMLDTSHMGVPCGPRLAVRVAGQREDEPRGQEIHHLERDVGVAVTEHLRFHEVREGVSPAPESLGRDGVDVSLVLNFGS